MRSRIHPTAEQAAFERLFDRYRQPLLDYLYGMTRDSAIAEDLVQETFLRAYASDTALTSVTYPQAWLYKIATNVAIDTSRRSRQFSWLPLQRVEPEAGLTDEGKPPAGEWYRSRGPSFGTTYDTFMPAMGQEDFVAGIAERDAVWQVLAELPPRWRAVLLLQTTAGFAVRDIGVLLNLKEGNIRKILYRAKERFREIYLALEAGELEGGRS